MGRQAHSSVEIRLKDLLALKQEAECWAFPQTKKNVYTGVGDTRSPFKSRGLDFQEVRTYQPGDDIRQIDWRVTAKYGKPFTKLYTEEKDQCLYFICDLRSGMHFASHGDFKSVVVARLTALLAFIAVQRNNKIGAAILTDEGIHLLPPDKSDVHLMALFHALEKPSSNISEKGGLPEVLKQLSSILPSGSYLFVLSDFYDWSEQIKNELGHFSIKNTLLLCPIYDELERQLPKGVFSFSNGKNVMILNTSKDEFQRKFSNAWEQRMHQLQLAASKQGWGLLSIRTDSDYLNILRQFCVQGEVL